MREVRLDRQRRSQWRIECCAEAGGWGWFQLQQGAVGAVKRVRRQSVYKVACSSVGLRLEGMVINVQYEGK